MYINILFQTVEYTIVHYTHAVSYFHGLIYIFWQTIAILYISLHDC